MIICKGCTHRTVAGHGEGWYFACSFPFELVKVISPVTGKVRRKEYTFTNDQGEEDWSVGTPDCSYVNTSGKCELFVQSKDISTMQRIKAFFTRGAI